MSEKLQVRDVMTAEPLVVSPEEGVQIAWGLMTDHQVRHLPVVDARGGLVGVLSQRDLLADGGMETAVLPPFAALRGEALVADVMTREVEAVAPDDDIREAAARMFERKLGCLPVVEEGIVIGILTESDFVRLMARGN